MTISFVAVANSPPPARKRHTLSLSSIQVTWRVVQREGLLIFSFKVIVLILAPCGEERNILRRSWLHG